jgi:hypothetical protein
MVITEFVGEMPATLSSRMIEPDFQNEKTVAGKIVKIVGINSELPEGAQIALGKIAAIFGWRAEIRSGENLDGLDAFVTIYDQNSRLILSDEIPALIFADSKKPLLENKNEVQFANHPFVPVALREANLVTPEIKFVGALPQFEFEVDALAKIGEQPVWVSAKSRNFLNLIVSSPSPSLKSNQRISEILNGETFLSALPVWIFFKNLSDDSKWQPAPLRACLIVDDPNLHRSRYGHIDYHALVEFARARPFHAAMATVPLDNWWVNDAAAKLFRENAATLSLIVHGNDHLRYELAQPFSEADRLALVLQSLKRISVLEKKAQLKVDRVMAPPHGVCAPEMMSLLWRCGFDGMTTNRWSLWKHSPPEMLPEDSGLHPVDFLGEGLPVAQRFRFNSPICRNEIHLAALFGQPILPYGHHQDFSQDMAAVRETVDAVNALGTVRWMSMKEIFETNFEQRIEEDTFRVRLFSRRVKSVLPVGTKNLQVEFSGSNLESGEEIVVKWLENNLSRQIQAQIGELIALPPECHFEVCLKTPPSSFSKSDLNFKRRPEVFLRRLAAEARDRLKF